MWFRIDWDLLQLWWLVGWSAHRQGLLHYLPAAAQPTIPPNWCFCLWTTLPLLPPTHHLCSFPDVFPLAASLRWPRPPWRTWWPSSPTWAPMCPSSRRSTCTRPFLRAWWVQILLLILFIVDFCLKVSMLSYRLTTFMLLAFVSLYSCFCCLFATTDYLSHTDGDGDLSRVDFW